MKEIRLQKSTDKVIGALRCSTRVYEKVEAMATAQNVTKQDIIRAILEEVIDEIKFK
jgi:predicted DNA-binding protein